MASSVSKTLKETLDQLLNSIAVPSARDEAASVLGQEREEQSLLAVLRGIEELTSARDAGKISPMTMDALLAMLKIDIELRVLAQKYERLCARLPPALRPPPYLPLPSQRPPPPAAAFASSADEHIRETDPPDTGASQYSSVADLLKEYYEDEREVLGTIEAKDKEREEETEGSKEDKPEKVRAWVGRKIYLLRSKFQRRR